MANLNVIGCVNKRQDYNNTTAVDGNQQINKKYLSITHSASQNKQNILDHSDVTTH